MKPAIAYNCVSYVWYHHVLGDSTLYRCYTVAIYTIRTDVLNHWSRVINIQ